MILSECCEHIYKSDNEAMEVAQIGAYFIRGDNIALLAKVERKIKEGDVFGDALPPMLLS